jgi:hypothetical protein
VTLQIFPAPGRRLWRLGLGALAAVALVAVAAHQWDRLWNWVPWSTEARLERALIDTERYRAEALVRSIESQANTDQLRRADTVHREVARVRDLTSPIIIQARSAADAHDTIEPERNDRLRRHDRELCGMARAICSGDLATTPEPAGHGH